LNSHQSKWTSNTGDQEKSSVKSSYIYSRKNASEFVVRKANNEDLNALAEILTNSFHPREGLNLCFHYLLKLGIYEDLRSRLRSRGPNSACLVVTIKPTHLDQTKPDIVATAEISLRREYSWSGAMSESPYISNLAVKDSYRRLGIARKLLTKCEQIALEWGYPQIFLHVLESNYQAKQLYLNSGYQIARSDLNCIEWLFQRPGRLLLVKDTPRREG